MLKKIQTLVQSQRHCVLATVGRGEAGLPEPHASLMSFCPSTDCREFWLATLKDTRKYQNLHANPRASLLLDDRAGEGQPSIALTVSAELAPFAAARDEARARKALLARHPNLAGFLALEEVLVLRLLARQFQLLSGLTQVFTVGAEKMLDADGRKA